MEKAERHIAIATPSLGEDEWRALREPLMSGWVTQGPKVAEFEALFAQLHQVDHAIAVTSCTTALHLILAALNIGHGDEVIVPAFTWIATANAVIYCGATPVFVDIDPATFNLEVKQIKPLITERTRAVIAVHLFGLCAEIERLREIIPPDVFIIEDAACAAGAISPSGYAGTLGTAAAFSFHPRKSITTGEGGMVTTQNSSLAERMRQLRNHGASLSEEQRELGPKPYLLPDFNLLGFNYRMTDLQGAIGYVQLQKLEGIIQERAKWAEFYRAALSDLPFIQTPQEPQKGRHSWQSFTVLLDPDQSSIDRNALMDRLQRVGISTRPGTHAVHRLGYYRDRFGYRPEDYPYASLCNDQSMSIPLHNQMSEADYHYVVEMIHQSVK